MPHPTLPRRPATIDDAATRSSYTVYPLGTDWAASGNVWEHGTYAIAFDLTDAMVAAGFSARVQAKIRQALA